MSNDPMVADTRRNRIRHIVGYELFLGGEVGSDLGPIVAASGLVYLVAAAVQKPSTAWPVFFASVVIVTVSKMGSVPIHATWLLLGVAAVFFIVGLVRGLTRSAQGLPLQSIAMLGFGGIAPVVLYFDGVLGADLVAVGLYAHAGWDAWHHWNDKVVSRSLAGFCFVLDALLATAIVVATLQYAQMNEALRVNEQSRRHLRRFRRVIDLPQSEANDGPLTIRESNPSPRQGLTPTHHKPRQHLRATYRTPLLP